MSEIIPNNTDAILGGQNPPPINAAVLGGEIGRKQRAKHDKTEKFWQNFEYFNEDPQREATIFADRQVIYFKTGMEIIEPKSYAYAIQAENIDEFHLKWNTLLKSHNINELEALIFAVLDWNVDWNVDFNVIIASAKNNLPNLKAVFLGDTPHVQISCLPFYEEISPILLNYDYLEYFQIRCNNGRNGRTGEAIHEGFSFCKPLKHDRLKVLRVESGGLCRRTILDLNQLELPALEYLELWFGSTNYGGNSYWHDLLTIIYGEKFPKLKYLGLRNCEYTDNLAFELARSPFLKHLYDLDLSMGTLGDEGLKALLDSPNINELCTLNVSKNYVSKGFIERVLPQFKLNCEVIIDNQQCEEYVDRSNRYCVVAE
jgi:hypothetical protein